MMNAYIGYSCRYALAGLLLAWIGMARAQDPALIRSPAGPLTATVIPPGTGSGLSALLPSTRTMPAADCSAVSDSRLDAIRGGFDFGNGLLASFGIDRVVYINGNLVSSTSVHIPDIARMTLEQANALAAVTGRVNMIQNGPGNTFNPVTLNGTTAATVIQNSLDNQNIQSMTTINTAVNSLGTFRDLNMQETLQTALIGSLGH